MSNHSARTEAEHAGSAGPVVAGEAEMVVDPSDEELAAIVAAVEATWARAVAEAPTDAPPRWRFSGRWWSKPVPLRRSRPW